MLQKLIDAWRARRKRREWTVERQLEELRVLVQMDHRWLAHDPVANALTSRYLKALNEHWYKVSTEDVRNLRERLGLCPHQRASSPPQPTTPRPPAAQERKPLTDEQISDMRGADLGALNFVTLREFRAIARAVEAAHGIKDPAHGQQT